MAASATAHCLTGCAIGEVLGLVIGTALGWSNAATIALAIVLAFLFGYSLTMLPLLRAGFTLGVAVPLAFASDTFSIAVMEIVDNGVMLAIPGAMDEPLSNPLFWGALAFAFAVAFVFAFPVNRYLIARGRGHAVVHAYHGGGGADSEPPPGLGSPRKLVLIGVAAIALTIAVAAGGAALTEHDGSGDGEHAPAHPASPGTASGVLSGLAVADDGYRLDAPTATLEVGKPTTFSFTVADGAGAVREFEEHGGVRMHLIVVRRDLVGYQHLHPELQSDGSWRTELTLPEAGVYRAFADFERDGEKTVLGTDLFVAGNLVPAPLPAAARATEIAGYRVELSGEAHVGAEATLDYRITRDGESVEVEPYLGASGHLVALREGDLAYLHVHPLEESPGEVSFAATFPTAGSYRLFLQFTHEGRVRTAPLTLEVVA
jgi:hypothetical protein